MLLLLAASVPTRLLPPSPQLAVLAEFRQDWQAAVASYQAAAAALQGVPLGRPTVSVQRHAEVTAVAEVAHFKALMLLLHQQRHAEAIAQLRSHLASFGRAPGAQRTTMAEPAQQKHQQRSACTDAADVCGSCSRWH